MCVYIYVDTLYLPPPKSGAPLGRFPRCGSCSHRSRRCVWPRPAGRASLSKGLFGLRLLTVLNIVIALYCTFNEDPSIDVELVLFCGPKPVLVEGRFRIGLGLAYSWYKGLGLA